MKLTPSFIYAQLDAYHSANNIIVGYSGGVDSHVLLHLLASIPELKPKIIAVYVHHGLQICADDWAVHCRKIANDLGVNFKQLSVNAQAVRGESPEEAARNARYQVFKDILKKNDVLLFAQHQDDQLETVLLQLFRGAGLKGLSGMPAAIDFGAGVLLRPLLEVTQALIKQYAEEQALQWIEDPSNQDRRFDRNYLRHDIIPLLEQRWPGLDKTVTRVARHCGQAQNILAASARDKMHLLYDAQKQCLSISGLLSHDTLSQQWILREWLGYLGLRMPTQKVMTAILHTLLQAQAGANPVVHHDGYDLQRYRDGLYLIAQQKKPDLSQVITWAKRSESLSLPNNGVLVLKQVKQGIPEQLWQQANIQVKYRQGGEKIALPYRTGRHSLKKLYQEESISPWQRERMPMIYINDCLAAIAGFWVSAGFYAQNDACISVVWQQTHPVNKR